MRHELIPVPRAFLLFLVLIALGACSGTDTVTVDPNNPLIEGLSPNPVALDGLPAMGADDATVTIIEVTDFQCPYCERAADTMKDLLQKFDGTKLRLVVLHMPLPFHQRAGHAAKAAIAAQRQGKFWPYHDLLWTNNRALQDEDLEAYAEQVGLDVEQWRKDYQSPETHKELNRQMAIAGALGVNGVPHFRVNGVKVVGARPLDDFTHVVQTLLDTADDWIAKGLPRAYVHAKMAQTIDGGRYYQLIFEGADPEDLKPAPKRNAPAGKRKDPVENHAALLKKVSQNDIADLTQLPIESADFDICVTQGPEDAAVTLVTFLDYECPFCRKYHNTFVALGEAHGRNVKQVVCMLPLSFHKNARLAARGAYAALQQARFWEYQEKLFAGGRLTPESIVGVARELGLDMELFEAHRSSDESNEWVTRQEKLAASLNVRGTPNSFINGFPLTGAQPKAQFEAVIKAQLAVVQMLLEKGLTAAQAARAIAAQVAPDFYLKVVYP